MGVSDSPTSKPRSRKPLSPLIPALPQAFDDLGLALEDIERGQSGGGGRGWKGSAEHHRTAEMLDPVEYLLRACDEAADGGQRLREGAHHQVDFIFDSEVAGGASPSFADDAERMRVVNEEAGLVAAADIDDLGQRRDVAAHAVDAVDYHEPCLVVGDALEDGLQMAPHRCA